MKTIVTLVLLIAMLPLAQAQTESPSDSTALGDSTMVADSLADMFTDTNKIKMGDKAELWILTQEGVLEDSGDDEEEEEPRPNKFWAGVELGVGGYLNKDNSLAVPSEASFMELDYARSINWSINFVEKQIPLIRNKGEERLSLITGMGFEWNNYSFTSDFGTLQARGDSVFSLIDSTRSFNKNRLKTTSLTIPLMIGYNSNSDRNKSFRMAAGIVGGYRFHTVYKQRYESGGDTFKPKVKSDFNLNALRYNATVRMGYRWFDLYATYALNTLFESGKGPELYPFTVGIRVLPL
ncbi:MAG: outer membrane beta-barrel protein [Salibacteraceae bacterium]